MLKNLRKRSKSSAKVIAYFLAKAVFTFSVKTAFLLAVTMIIVFAKLEWFGGFYDFAGFG